MVSERDTVYNRYEGEGVLDSKVFDDQERVWVYYIEFENGFNCSVFCSTVRSDLYPDQRGSGVN